MEEIQDSAEKRFLAVDYGNTRIKATLLDDKEVYSRHSFSLAEVDEFLNFARDCGAEKGGMIASGRIDARIAESLRRVFSEGFVTVTSSTELPIAILYGCPETLGIDRKTAAVAAAKLMPEQRVLIVDAGTALTMDIENEGVFEKGNISAGLSMRFMALSKFTAALPEVDWRAGLDAAGNIQEFGNDTRRAIACGVVNGFLDEIAGGITRGLDEGVKRVIITGGDAPMIMKYLPQRLEAAGIETELIYEQDLIAKGLREIYRHHENKI